MEAEIFGNLIMFAWGFFTKSPNSANASGICCSGFRYDGKFAKILPAREMSFVSKSIAQVLANALTEASVSNLTIQFLYEC